MIAAGGIILATPNYIFNVSGQLKVFIDRCSSLIHCMALDGKYGACVVTSGGGDEWPIVQYLNHFLRLAVRFRLMLSGPSWVPPGRTPKCLRKTASRPLVQAGPW